MEIKDWVLLLIPILFNGIIIYFIQAYFQRKLKQDEHKHEIKRKINNKFFSLLLEVKNNFRRLGYLLQENPNYTKLFEEYLSEFNQSIRKSLDYYGDYKLYLNDFSSEIVTLDSTFEEYISYGLMHQQLDNISRKKLQDYINRLFQLICHASDRHLENI